MESFQLANESSPLSLTPNFILPEHKRPHLSEVKYLDSIPIIDLSYCDGNNPSSLEVIHKISKACEEFGFFQIVNHGVPDQVCTKMMKAITNFFELAPEEREHLSSTDNTKNVRLFNYYLQVDGGEKVKLWSECFAHPWYPIDDIIQLLPEKIGTQYREAFTEYAKEVGSLVRRLLSLISIGLGLEEDCLLKKLGEQPRQRAQSNFYPPCPDPELTMGLNEHTDLNALTVLLQSEVSGLQVNKDGKWISIPCIPNAFVINLADQIEVLSNGRYKSVLHRAVTNNVQPRISMAMFYGPNPETIIGPIHELIDEEHPPKYRNYHFSKFLEEFFNQEGTRRIVKEVFELPC
ncbi:putative oxidoreductase [Medicago truncatula]|uniref:1-aminocyclopropane-1-carboxylate oxidase n=1 Tax=Medicago truncatula TaxID=3880 RepID=G7JXT3_MEDTR|nr:protein DMR6-LIKE OXYGENASE 1 isoform X1 [Medicago truncatula]AES96068.1 1-aminocyclopropane-1-carboxylate oxidase [Medicago truncatula]RHN54968.1 putative oxidoreductase [Medicago truncatula]